MGGSIVISNLPSEMKGTWEKEKELAGHSNWVRDVAWAPDTGFTTSTIASCSHDGAVIIWQCKDLTSGEWEQKVRHINMSTLHFYYA